MKKKASKKQKPETVVFYYTKEAIAMGFPESEERPVSELNKIFDSEETHKRHRDLENMLRMQFEAKVCGFK